MPEIAERIDRGLIFGPEYGILEAAIQLVLNGYLFTQKSFSFPGHPSSAVDARTLFS